MRPASIPTLQAMNSVANILNSNTTAAVNMENPATSQQVETLTDGGQRRQSNDERPTCTDIQSNMTASTMNRQIGQTSCTHCSCHHQSPEGIRDANVPVTENQRLNLHTEYEDRSKGASKFFLEKKQTDISGLRECQIIRILPDENDDYLDIVRDSISAQTRRGPKPMFVNNYFVGDNNWRTVPRENPDTMRHLNESRSRSSTGVQTAVSFLGEEDKGSSILQTGLARVKSMGTNEANCNVQSPVVVEPTKQGNSMGWSTHSFNIPDSQQDTSGQQCKGFPDFTVPPPPIPPQDPTQGCGDRGDSTILKVMEKMTEAMDQQMRLSATRADYNMQQNTKIMDQFIRAQDRRDLDPALMDIPTFTGENSEKCLEWVTRIKNVCRQSGRSFQQELTNKSGLVIQNFLSSLDVNITENDLVEKILQMFSDIPTTTQAIKKLKELQQGETESILAYNQRYKTLVERIEGKPIEQITSPVAMEMYLGTIITPLKKSIKNSLFWNSKHAPNTVGEAMSKAQQLYVKHLYSAGEDQNADQKRPVEDVVINEISRKFENKYRGRRDDYRDSSNNRRENYNQDQRKWQNYDNRKDFMGTENRNGQ